MPQYSFQSYGGTAVDSIEKMLIEEDARRRRDMLDKITMGEVQNRAEDRRQALDDRTYDREALAASRWDADHSAGEQSPAFVEMLRKHGYGGDITEQNIPSGETQLDGETADTQRMRPALMAGGGTRQVQARNALDQKNQHDQELAQSKAAEAARKSEYDAEQKRLEHDRKLEITNMTLAAKRESDALRNDLTKQGLDDKKEIAAGKVADKKAEEEKVLQSKREKAQGLAQESLDLVDKLLTPDGKLQPGVSGIVGPARLYLPSVTTALPGFREVASAISGGDVRDKWAAQQQLTSKAVLNVISELKSQSKTGATGFGSLSEREGDLLRSAALQLDNAQTETAYADALKALRTKLQLVFQEPGKSALGTGGKINIDPDAADAFKKYGPSAGGGAVLTAAQRIAQRRGGK